jgi:large subunit ribosomal protein L25
LTSCREGFTATFENPHSPRSARYGVKDASIASLEVVVMSQKWSLSAQTRTLTGKKAKRLLQQGYVPASVYGPDLDSVAIQIPQQELLKALSGAGATHVIDLSLDSRTIKVLIKHVDVEPITRRVRHVSLFAADMKELVTIKVPLTFTGESAAVRKGGNLSHVTDSIDVQCLPDRIPETIFVDLSQMEDFNSLIRVADLPVPEGAQVMTDMETVVAKVAPPKTAAAIEEEISGEPAVAEEVATQEE